MIGEIEEEHEVMQAWLALKKCSERGRGFAGSGLLRREMGGICKGFGGCKGGFQGCEATAEEYNNATKALQDAYKALTAKPESGGGSSPRRQKIQNTEKRNKSRGNEGKQRNKSKGENKSSKCRLAERAFLLTGISPKRMRLP